MTPCEIWLTAALAPFFIGMLVAVAIDSPRGQPLARRSLWAMNIGLALTLAIWALMLVGCL